MRNDSVPTRLPSVRPEAPVRHLRDWSSLLSKSFMRFTVESDRPAQFRGSLGIRSIAGIDFIEMSTGSHVAQRDAASIRRDDRPNYLLCLQVAGVGEFLQDDRVAVLHPGDITLFDTTRPTTVISSANYRNLCMKFPQQLFDIPQSQMSQLTATRFDAQDGLTPAAGAVLTTLNRVADTLQGRSRQLAAHNALDLMTTLFGSRLGLPDGTQRRASAALLEQMLDFIDRNLADPDLSPGTLAMNHYISLRRVHGIFSDAGLTVSAHILSRRLERCRRDLTDPRMLTVAVVSIGARWGFRTASHFGRAFKERFGRTPAEYRLDAMERRSTVIPS
ncbi:AraC-like ligand-binding domain-containing protein [Parafrigoribacterium soli]|uniref:AraC-like ligand-binding domain-containing protein n=1 Tax=Parafrigoribacterium soli TaxID=3144663 RepID=UPI0032ED1BDD